MNQQCKVCGEPAAGYHFGAFTCEGCKVSNCFSGCVCVRALWIEKRISCEREGLVDALVPDASAIGKTSTRWAARGFRMDFAT